VPVVMNEATSQTPTNPTLHQDWSVKFRSMHASIMKETYDAFFNDEQRSLKPVDFLNYLLSGIDLPRCETVDGIPSITNGVFSEFIFLPILPCGVAYL